MTTDHISPGRLDRRRGRPPASGSRSTASAPLEFNSYGARRGHHEVMMRGTFGNIRLRNQLVAGQGGPVHDPPARRRGGVHLRRRDALPRRGRAAARHRRPRVRLRLVARLGGQGHGAARRPRGHRRELRAHPPLEPGRHGRPAAPVPARRERRVAGPDRPRGVTRSRGLADGLRRGSGHGRRPARRRRRPSAGSARSPGSTARSRSTTTARAGSCRPSCAGSPAADRGSREESRSDTPRSPLENGQGAPREQGPRRVRGGGRPARTSFRASTRRIPGL